MSVFERRDKDEIENTKTLVAVLLLFIVAILCSSILVALADWHNHLWFWGIK